MTVYSIGDVAARLTRLSGEYVATHRVYDVVRRLIEAGELIEHRAGRQHTIIECDLPTVESEFGITAAMVAAAENTER